MKLFVTGGAGYIGSVTCEQLLAAGHEVTVYDNLGRGHRAAIDPRARLIEGDLADRGAVTRALQAVEPEAVLHFAAYALVGESMAQPELYFDNNVVGGLNLIEGMRVAGVRKFIFSSTCATYGQPERMPMTEDLPQRPENPYGESKLMFETMLRWYERIHGFEPVFLRYFNAAGATATFGEDHDPESHLIPLVLRVALGQRPEALIFGDDYDTPDGTCIRDYIHIVDLAQAHMLALKPGLRDAFNLGNGDGYSVKQVIETARAVTGHPIPARVAPRRPGDPARLIASAQRAHEMLGWRPQYPQLRAIIEHAWAWHQAHPRGYAD
ncbi:MAG: UDP-glucose 4-epimerase GalE [Candidatus Marinimicrobia bacterium]|nr:UDP-glucose 4-epimerase GalE [Candidatus Neomarinimicrobiota bacterium]